MDSLLAGGATRNRTGDEGFADLCLTAWLWRHMLLKNPDCFSSELRAPRMKTNFFYDRHAIIKIGAGDGARTRHLSLGKAALYQMSYSRRKLVPQSGLEPPTQGFSVPCSTS